MMKLGLVYILSLVILAVVSAGVIFLVLQNQNQETTTFPRKSFPVSTGIPEKLNVPSPKVIVSKGCIVGGCNGELCSEKTDEMNSICIARPEFQCYRTAVCERQPNGGCGWTKTRDLTNCLANYSDYNNQIF